jgi:hypothetical protein
MAEEPTEAGDRVNARGEVGLDVVRATTASGAVPSPARNL